MIRHGLQYDLRCPFIHLLIRLSGCSDEKMIMYCLSNEGSGVTDWVASPPPPLPCQAYESPAGLLALDMLSISGSLSPVA